MLHALKRKARLSGEAMILVELVRVLEATKNGGSKSKEKFRHEFFFSLWVELVPLYILE